MKFLADEQFPHGCSVRLRALGLEVEEVSTNPALVGTDEVNVLLPYAKRRRQVLLSGDHMEDRETRLRLLEHFYRTKKGKVVIVKNATNQHWTRTIAKLLWHINEIEHFFANNGHGLITVGDLQQCRMQRPGELPRVVRRSSDQGFEYLQRKAQKRAGPRNPNLVRAERADLKGQGELL